MSRQIPGAIHCAMKVGIAIGLSIHAQTVKPEFEVASVKPCAPNTVAGIWWRGGSRADLSVASRLRRARRGSTATYQITLKNDGSPMAGTAVADMTQALLEDQFRLKVHKETREVPAYALVASKGGIRLPAAQTSVSE
jgi:Protein of unknown function (DUF3738)